MLCQFEVLFSVFDLKYKDRCPLVACTCKCFVKLLPLLFNFMHEVAAAFLCCSFPICAKHALKAF
jgi:hypothetical protein